MKTRNVVVGTLILIFLAGLGYLFYPRNFNVTQGYQPPPTPIEIQKAYEDWKPQVVEPKQVPPVEKPKEVEPERPKKYYLQVKLEFPSRREDWQYWAQKFNHLV